MKRVIDLDSIHLTDDIETAKTLLEERRVELFKEERVAFLKRLAQQFPDFKNVFDSNVSNNSTKEDFGLFTVGEYMVSISRVDYQDKSLRMKIEGMRFIAELYIKADGDTTALNYDRFPYWARITRCLDLAMILLKNLFFGVDQSK